MKSPTRRTDPRTLGRLLRDADPARDGGELGAAEAAAILHRLLGVARGVPAAQQRRRLGLAVALASAAAVCLLLAVLLVERQPPRPTPGGGRTLATATTTTGTTTAPATGAAARRARRGAATPALGAGTDDRAPRQVQFTTAGGTRIVWLLLPPVAD